MTSTEAIEFISSVLTHDKAVAKFTVTEVSPPDGETLKPPPIFMKIEGSHLGESAAAMLLIHPKRQFDDDTKEYLRTTAARSALMILDILESKINARIARAARNN